MKNSPFEIPGALTDDTPFTDMHVWQWASEQPREARALSLENYLASLGFVVGRDRLTEAQYDTIASALDTFQRCAPHLKGEHKLSSLMTPASAGGFYLYGHEERFTPSAEVVAALVGAGWIYGVSPATTYFEICNGILWAKYQQIIGSRPLARISTETKDSK